MIRCSFARIAAVVFALACRAHTAFAIPDIVFVTQPPHPTDFATVNATFGNHRASLDSVPRGGDLYIRYSDGTLKNVTASAGYGVSGFQDSHAIAVRDPSVYWDGKKILFSMAIGAPDRQYQYDTYHWQLYEVTGIGKNETPVITKVPNQPDSYNNVMGTYGSDDRIIFVSDRPRDGLTHTYPQRDEYESTASNTGLWSLDPQSGDLQHLDHSPSGDFSPSIDSFGRLIFVRWDHLQRDQQNRCSNAGFGAFNFASEAADAAALDTDAEVFPEPRGACEDDPNDHLDLHSFNHFLPWSMNQDGTELETINHVGRHELTGYIGKTFDDDPNVEEYYGQYSRVNTYSVTNLLHLREDALVAGRYYAISAPEFGTHASGQIVRFDAPPTLPADQIVVTPVTHPDTQYADDTPSVNHIGLTRDPLSLSDGTLIAAHTAATAQDSNIGTTANPLSKYDYRIKTFAAQGQYFVPQTTLTPGITKTLSFWSPDELVTYTNVTMWELEPREIKATARPQLPHTPLPAPESKVFADEGVDPQVFKDFLVQNNLALIVSRNVTTRDKQDHQQPQNLKIAGSDTQTLRTSGKIYEVAHLQIFQGDLVRAYGGSSNSSAGRRVIAQALHSVTNNPPDSDGPPGSVKLGSDGSMAAFVPARHALTYQLTDAAGSGVVRERLWLTFQPGEMRVCTSCHGINSIDQAGHPKPENQPEALRTLLEYWKQNPGGITAPAISLRVQKARANGNALRPGDRLKVTLTGQSANAANKSVKVEATAGKTSCGVVLSATTDASGNFAKTSAPLSLTSGTINLDFRLKYGSILVDSASLKLRQQARRPPKGAKICAALQKALR